MRAALVQIVGLAIFAGFVAAIDWRAGGAAAGGVLVFVGLALEERD